MRRKPTWHSHISVVRYLPIPLFFIALTSVILLYFKRNTNPSAEHRTPFLAKRSFELPNRVKLLFESKHLIGGSLNDINSGYLSTRNVLNAVKNENKSPMELEEIFDFLTNFLHMLHAACAENKNATFQQIWKIYHDLVMKELYPWDREYLSRMPERRRDGTIFLAIASYRDENCLSTIKQAYAKAKNPEKLIIGLVQQNCEADCRTGVLTNLKMEPTEPDEDCHKVFCESDEGKSHCDAGRVRALHVNETESLGPYAARYFGSKLWYGEEWFMQIDSHMTFAQDWDALSIEMLENAPSNKPVISHYPPSETFDFEKFKDQPAPRLCGGIIADTYLEAQIVRLQNQIDDTGKKIKTPRFAPVIAAGYYVASSEFLQEVPFDPFLPWIFMGEEIIMSARMWTHGYDIFSPTENVVGHIYGRRHKPKFWENTHRVFRDGVHNPLQKMILHRVKFQIGYPESSRDMIPPNILTKVEEYTLGSQRSLEDYLKMAGFNFYYKLAYTPLWCAHGFPPPLTEYQKYNNLYQK